MKPSNDEFEKLSKHFVKMSLKYANINIKYIFDKKISKAQAISKKNAKEAYSEVYMPLIKKSNFNIALDVLGKKIDSFEFSSFFEDNLELNFFIGGAYGLQEEFLNKCNKVVSLSQLTMSHKVSHLVLLEQIFRGLCIKNNHPYHK